MEEVASSIQVRHVICHQKYLGLLTFMPRNRKETLNYIKDRVWSQLQGWKNRLFSIGGKEVLLKASYFLLLHELFSTSLWFIAGDDKYDNDSVLIG